MFVIQYINESIMNHPPVLDTISITVNYNTITNHQLHYTDKDNDTVTFTLIEQPQNGKILWQQNCMALTIFFLFFLLLFFFFFFIFFFFIIVFVLVAIFFSLHIRIQKMFTLLTHLLSCKGVIFNCILRDRGFRAWHFLMLVIYLAINFIFNYLLLILLHLIRTFELKFKIMCAYSSALYSY